jgi:UDP-N-acetylglucosamine--N-acetylmuramyl-(pentapeptide) pyrophosphoryl-undecaprenol N-acetylglucosamine transferase
MRIILTAGGSGGHLFPLIAVARKLKEKLGSETELLYVGSGLKIEKKAMVGENIPMKNIFAGKMRRYFSIHNFFDFFKIPIGFFQSLFILLKFMPDAVFAKGGYVSLPVVLAARCYRIPVLIHESDAIPGASNQILAKFSNRIAISYPSAYNYFPTSKTIMTGNPIRTEIYGGDSQKARTYFSLTESKPVILVLGGSQGSRTINNAIINILPKLLPISQVIHQTGENNFMDVVRMAGEQGIKPGHGGYCPTKFLEGEVLPNSFSVADLIISRAGANSIAEIAANGKPSILIPLEHSANDHQRMNAYKIAEVGGALVLEETNLGENILIKKIEQLLFNAQERKSMAEKVKAFFHPDASDKIADGIIELGNE